MKELICREYKVCEYNKNCIHAKRHSVVRWEYPRANDCITEKRKNLPCYCNCIDLRKEKLERIENGKGE